VVDRPPGTARCRPALPWLRATKSDQLDEARAFHALGFSTLLVDHRGHGGSAGDWTSIGYHEATDVVAAVDYDRILSAIRNRFGSMGLPSFPSAELLAFWGGVQMGFPAFRHSPVDYARTITVPVLMLHGADDPRATRQQARRVFEVLPGHKAFVEISGRKHQSLYRASPEPWTNAVAGFPSPWPRPLAEPSASGGRRLAKPDRALQRLPQTLQVGGGHRVFGGESVDARIERAADVGAIGRG